MSWAKVANSRDGNAHPAPSSSTSDADQSHQFSANPQTTSEYVPVLPFAGRRFRSMSSARRREGEKRWSASRVLAWYDAAFEIREEKNEGEACTRPCRPAKATAFNWTLNVKCLMRGGYGTLGATVSFRGPYCMSSFSETGSPPRRVRESFKISSTSASIG